MKCTIPEISWHNKDPVLSIDIQPNNKDGIYKVASGGSDCHILIWQVVDHESGVSSLECLSELTRHQKAVNVVRFSPSGNLLASGDDEAVIILWKQKTDQDPIEFPSDEENKYKEEWRQVKVLRGHLEDVYDLSWSSDEQYLISGSVDNTAIVWDIKKGRMKSILRDHKSFVQGVAWDPAGKLLATLSCDRICRIFNASTHKVVNRIGKAILPGAKADSKPTHLFHDDTLKSFFRRLCFTPCGSLLIAPSGVIEPQEQGKNKVNATLIFTRNSLPKPVVYLPSYGQYSVAVRCCPKFFTLKDSTEAPLFNLPYRVVFAIASQSSVILYDTQHYSPFAHIANIHYTRLTDLTWSSDGKMLIVSSTDGYCSIITFTDGELGELYVPKSTERLNSKLNSTTPDDEDCQNVRAKESIGKQKELSKLNVNDKTKNRDVEIFGNDIEKSDVGHKKNDTVKNSDNDFHLILEESINDANLNNAFASNKDKKDSKCTSGFVKSDNNGTTLNQTSQISNINISENVISTAGNLLKLTKKDITFNNTASDKLNSHKIVPSVEQTGKPITKNISQGEYNSEDSCKSDKVQITSDEMSVLNINKTPSKYDDQPNISSNSQTPSGAFCKNTTPPHKITPIEKRKPKRAQLITLSSPKSKKKL